MDTVLDFCVDRRLKLHLDLAQRRDFSLASESSEIYSRDTPEQQNWFQLVDAFLHHIRRRYTEQMVSQWVFELTFYLNEPYDAESGLSDLEVWKRGYTLIKSVFPKARVAGPGTDCLLTVGRGRIHYPPIPGLRLHPGYLHFHQLSV